MSERILLLEDDVLTAKFIADNLRADDHEVTLQDTGEPPALIVLDSNMLNEGNRVRYAYPDVPVVLLLGKGDAIPAGWFALVPKPFAYSQLLREVRLALHSYGRSVPV